MTSGNKIRVLVIDDSAVIRRLLTVILSRDPQIEVVGTASDGQVARGKVKSLHPDVLTLDVEMPKIDGLTFLRNLMRLHPMPVVMVSTHTAKGASVTLDALDYGAVDFICKPEIDSSNTLEDYADEIIRKVKMASTVRVRRYEEKGAAEQLCTPDAPQSKIHSVAEILPRIVKTNPLSHGDKIIAIGASTGGTDAIRRVLEVLPINMPGIVITQHIPELFSKKFAERTNARCAISVVEARDGEKIQAGTAYIAPGDRHLLVVKDGMGWRCKLNDGFPVNRHKPSVDVLFKSIANCAGQKAVGIILTGMGKDGAEGLKEMRDNGARTIAQDEASSIVWGMPGTAVSLGAAEKVISLNGIGSHLVNNYSHPQAYREIS